MFITRVNQIANSLPRHWESESRKGTNFGVKALACVLKAELLVHSTGRPRKEILEECRVLFGVQKGVPINCATWVLEHSTVNQIVEAFNGVVSIYNLSEIGTNQRYDSPGYEPELLDGDSGEVVAALAPMSKAARARQKAPVEGYLTPNDVCHNEARRILNFEHKVGLLEYTDLRLALSSRVFRFVCKIILDKQYKPGEILSLEEITTEKTIFEKRTSSEEELRIRRDSIINCLSAVVTAFNYMCSASPENGFALIPKQHKGKITGLIIPTLQEDVDVYFLKLHHRQDVATEKLLLTENRILALNKSGIASLQLPSKTAPASEPEKAKAVAGD